MASGFALRIATCFAGTTNCHDLSDFRYAACCPADTRCLTQVNATVNCCPTADNCTAANLARPQCANRTWNLYDGPRDRYFCCDPRDRGYALADGKRAGCAKPTDGFDVGEHLLTIVPTGTQGENHPAREAAGGPGINED